MFGEPERHTRNMAVEEEIIVHSRIYHGLKIQDQIQPLESVCDQQVDFAEVINCLEALNRNLLIGRARPC